LLVGKKKTKPEGENVIFWQKLLIGRRSTVYGPDLPAASRRCHRSYRGGCSFGEAEDLGLDGKKG